jgi:serine/threonine protein kinase/Flp pilus assembly protein TadD
MPNHADRDLLHGLIALQNHFIDQSDLLAAFHGWSDDRSKPLVQILRNRGALSDDDAHFLEALVARHLLKFGGDAARSLAALSTIESARRALERVNDPEIQASLAHVSIARDADADATRVQSPSDFLHIPASRFRVLRFHARGGLGQVSVALDKELGREVAFKEIQDQHADKQDHRTRFQLEAEITGGLEHPGIVPVYSLGHDVTGRPFYAMRFIRGDNLHDAIKEFHGADQDTKRDPGERSLALRKLLGRFLDVCNAIAYAHSRGVLHRDLKPGNIMLGDYGETLVVDWGLAKLLDAPDVTDVEGMLHPASASGSIETLAGTAVGTPAYMSPEQATGRLDQLGPASDVYSLGATLYALLTGRPPYEGQSEEVVARVPRGDFPPPRRVDPRIPAALEAICLKAMALDPAARYPTPKALADDVEHWLADEPVSAHPERLPAKVQRWMRRHKSATLSAAAALVAISVVATSAFLVVRTALAAEKKALAERTKALTAEQTALAAQTKATEAADRDRKRAEQRETMAVDAIKKFEKAVVDNPLLKNDPRLKPLRDTLLKEPLQFSRNLRTLLQADGDTRPDSLARLADACGSLGYTTHEIGDQEDALKAFAEALEILERLARDNPAVAAYQNRLANSHNSLGNLQRATGRADLAAASYARAIEIGERLARENPTVAAYQDDLAGSHNNLGLLQAATGRADLAAASYARATEIYERVARENPTVAAYQNGLAKSHNNLGTLQFATGRADLASSSFARAVEIFERLARENPSVIAYQGDLAAGHSNLGVLQRATGRADLASSSYARAIEIFERVARENPTVAAYQNGLAKSHYNLGTLQFATGRADLASSSFARAVEIFERVARENPSVIAYQGDLASSLNIIGNLQGTVGRTDLALASYQRALEIFERLARENPAVSAFRTGMASSHYSLACMLALKAAATADVKMAKSFADQAMESLRRADAAGWSDWKHAAEDDDLKSLRDRPDFQALLRERMKPKDAAKE